MLEIDQIELPSSSASSPSDQSIRSGKSEKTLRKSGKPFQFVPSACQVCLGKATGHHYDVASCNGCKSFFRRVTIEKLKYKCQAERQCFDGMKPGDPVPKCRACRFQKCLAAGMNHLGIQSELRKLGETLSSEKTRECTDIVVLPKIVEPPKSIEAQVADLIKHLVNLDMKTSAFRDCTYNPTSFPSLKDAIRNEHSIIGLADRMPPMPGWPLAPDVIAEIKKPNASPGTPRTFPPHVKRWLMYDLLTIVEMAKTFDFFKKLSESDRFYLCRDTALMVSNLTRAFFCFEKNRDDMIRPDGQVLSQQPPTWLPVDIHQKLIRDILKRAIGSLIRLKCSKIEFLLLRAIVLCNSTAPEISAEARSILSLERCKYTRALLNYVMANNGMDGPGRFAQVLNIIDVLEHQQKDQRDINVYLALYRPKWVKVPLLDDVMLTC
ncbi:unnamed protein product [Caenorhabditis sp. 36 PRJEB53466]|nr:unnamed protein product [Caenorhabditis sp. 36 PRJEB53466]